MRCFKVFTFVSLVSFMHGEAFAGGFHAATSGPSAADADAEDAVTEDLLDKSFSQYDERRVLQDLELLMEDAVLDIEKVSEEDEEDANELLNRRLLTSCFKNRACLTETVPPDAESL